MKVIAKVLDVTEKTINNKAVADVSLKSGGDLISITLWNNEFQKGTHNHFKKLIGKYVRTDLSAELYQGRLQYKFDFGFEVHDLEPAAAMEKPKAVNS